MSPPLHLTLTTTLSGRRLFCPHFTAEEPGDLGLEPRLVFFPKPMTFTVNYTALAVWESLVFLVQLNTMWLCFCCETWLPRTRWRLPCLSWASPEKCCLLAGKDKNGWYKWVTTLAIINSDARARCRLKGGPWDLTFRLPELRAAVNAEKSLQSWAAFYSRYLLKWRDETWKQAPW